MRELSTIQKRENLNKVFAADEPGKGGANHEYDIYPAQDFNEETYPYIVIRFQNGARKLPDSKHGVLDTDLLEIVRDRLKGFQKGGMVTEPVGRCDRRRDRFQQCGKIHYREGDR